MKRCILLCLIGLFAMTSCSNNSLVKHGDIPFRPFDGLNGKVAEVTRYSYSAKMYRGEMKLDETPSYSLTKTYNKDGHVVSSRTISANGEETIVEYKYNKGKLLSVNELSKKDDGSTESREYVVVDDTNVHTIFHIDGDSTKVENDVYKGLKRYHYDVDGVLRYVMTYNAQGVVVNTEGYFDGEIAYTFEETVDDNGLIVSSKSNSKYWDSEVVSYTYNYAEFDHKKNWTKCVVYKGLSDMDVDEVVVRDIKYR